MEKKCAKCGKKLGLLNKVPIKDGYLCKECAKDYKNSITDEKLKFKDLSIEALEEKHTKANQKNMMLIGVLILAIVVGIVFLAISGSGKEGKEHLSGQNEKTEAMEEDKDDAGNWEEEINDEENPDEVSEKDETRKYECGDTAHYDDYDITVENPVKGVNIEGSYTGVHDSRNFLKVPVTIKCKSDVTIGSGNFSRKLPYDYDYKKDDLPEELKMEKGETFTGYIYIPWESEKVSFGDDPSLFSNNTDGDNSQWIFTYSPKTKKCESLDDLYKLLPGDKAKATVYYYEKNSEDTEEYIGFNNLVAVTFEKDSQAYVYLSVKDRYLKRLKQSEDYSYDKFVIKGTLVRLGKETEDGYFQEEVLDDVRIIE